DSARLLFIAHREEILKQSVEVFRSVLKEPNFGELFVGSYNKPSSAEHLFVSIQTAESRKLYENVAADYYDFIVVDEFHHAAAKTYQNILNYFMPKIFLGLTATPERSDGKSILDYFDGRIAAEIRLPEAINRKLLCPFQYFGVSDDVDLRSVRWTNGGYDKTELSNIYTIDLYIA
ncbi:DEAD/DEAH box helicase family protein, partial [uncultured Anaerovibrio sp.]|uniref:DEAD/DEAH box helicase family protein n=1 Tax=uncultured Anaerovibrio sp. TaxID=361586 RepID=UPI002617EF56